MCVRYYSRCLSAFLKSRSVVQPGCRAMEVVGSSRGKKQAKTLAQQGGLQSTQGRAKWGVSCARSRLRRLGYWLFAFLFLARRLPEIFRELEMQVVSKRCARTVLLHLGSPFGD